MDMIRLRGLVVLGRHGLLAEEQARAQPFRVDVDLEVDLHGAGASDELGDTVDYGALAEMVARVVRTEHHRLLERLATRLAEACLTDERVAAVTIEVTKTRPPVPESLDSAAVRIRRSRPT